MTLFIVCRHIDYEGFRIVHTATSVESAVGEAERLIGDDDWADGFTVVALSPGPGPGSVVAEWRSSWGPEPKGTRVEGCDACQEDGLTTACPEHRRMPDRVWDRVL